MLPFFLQILFFSLTLYLVSGGFLPPLFLCKKKIKIIFASNFITLTFVKNKPYGKPLGNIRN